MEVGSVTLANSTFTLFCSMGVMTMKTISNTSITSTIGVTLMLELTLAPSFRTAIAIVLLRGSRCYSVFKGSDCLGHLHSLGKHSRPPHLQISFDENHQVGTECIRPNRCMIPADECALPFSGGGSA